MSIFDGNIGGFVCLVTGICAIPFLFSLRSVSRGRLPGWNFTIVALASVCYFGAGIGMINHLEWKFYPLIPASLLTGVIFVLGSRIHFRIAGLRNVKGHQSNRTKSW